MRVPAGQGWCVPERDAVTTHCVPSQFTHTMKSGVQNMLSPSRDRGPGSPLGWSPMSAPMRGYAVSAVAGPLIFWVRADFWM
jgi:hypothetical protein